MNIVKHENHNSLIPFYLSRGIEISEEFERIPVFSYIVRNDDDIIAAITCSSIDRTFIVEAIAVDKRFERKHIGTDLLNFAIEKMKEMNATDIILNAKNPILFEKNSFVSIDKDEVPVDAYSYCFNCPKYNIDCFPKMMKYIGNK